MEERSPERPVAKVEVVGSLIVLIAGPSRDPFQARQLISAKWGWNWFSSGLLPQAEAAPVVQPSLRPALTVFGDMYINKSFKTLIQ